MRGAARPVFGLFDQVETPEGFAQLRHQVRVLSDELFVKHGDTRDALTDALVDNLLDTGLPLTIGGGISHMGFPYGARRSACLLERQPACHLARGHTTSDGNDGGHLTSRG